MGGKKAASAKEKAAEKAKEATAAQEKAKEDADWAAAGEGKKSKAQAKRGAKEEERQEAQAKKLEAKRLADEEAASLAAASKKGGGASKVTAFELNKQREADQRQAQDAAAQRDMAQRREVGQQDYERLVETENVNAVDAIDARDVDTALAQLSVGEEQPKMKFSQYHERELPELKLQKPGLKGPQYKDIIWKKWLRSPENPLNQKEKT